VEIPGPANPSLWVTTGPSTAFPPLDGDLDVDVAVLGGGITGVTVARLLKAEGKSVALVEARRIGHGVTGYTTAKLTLGHGIVYTRLERQLGARAARLYAESNQAGVERVARFVEEEGIECDFERTVNVVYIEAASDVPILGEELAAAGRAGVEARFTTETELPFRVAGAIEVGGQAQFHPRRYLVRLAERLPGGGSHIFELTRALDVREQGRVCVLETDRGAIRARDVVVATHLPFLDRGLFFARTQPSMSYAISAPIDAEQAPRGMYISVGQPTRSIRSTPHSNPSRMLIVGGEGHTPGTEANTRDRYLALEQFLVDTFDAGQVEHRWSAHDYLPADDLPYVGRLTRGSEHVYVATGFAKWGLAKGTYAAMLITDLIVGRANPLTELYDTTRLRPAASARRLLLENAQVARHFFLGRIRSRPSREEIEALRPGEGVVARVARRRVAAFRDDSGTLNTLSATCTHLGCPVEWNTAERTWDCPCHGSRFAATGEVIEGPATTALQPIRLE